MNVPLTPDVVKDIVDNADERELWIVGREFERPPYFHAGKGGDTRLARALRLCTDDKITPNSDGSYQVEGSAGRTYRVADSCSCPNSQKASSKYCYHFVGVCLYIEWQRRLRPVAPVALGTVRDATRLSTAHVPQEDAYDVTQEELMASDDADAYIPEPDNDDAPVAVLEAPGTMPPAPVKIPREFTVNIKGKTHVLYTGLVIAARAHGLTSLAADWTYNDADLSLAHAVCTFADGRRYEESGDASPGNVSKGISLHFRRVALTRAKARCLRDALGISECSVEEMEEESGKPSVPVMTPNPLHPVAELRQRIWAKVQELAPQVKTREAVEAFIKERTGMDLHPDFFEAISNRLEGRA